MRVLYYAARSARELLQDVASVGALIIGTGLGATFIP